MLSIPHLIIIFVVALVVFGPEKLPELARTLGKVMGEFRRATGDLRSTFEDHMRDLEREADQRRIGGGPKAVPPTTSAVTTAPSTEQPTGTVPTSAPNSTERTEPAAYLPDQHLGDSESANADSTATHPTGNAHETESNSETVSDGGKFPA
ncbi:MAG TPA: twin-arginine translocase TatA/TatE family subunit [Candidatus Acidoferrales bacterium]|nr:twin-arginine translocase TatA/TatE family subunit [Candidatus Acidoferrales bacterium]